MNRPKRQGTEAETGLVEYAKTRGFSNAHRLVLNGAFDRGDVLLSDRWCDGGAGRLIAECKSTRNEIQFGPWMRELSREILNWEQPDRTAGILVVKYRGAGNQSRYRWFSAISARNLNETGLFSDGTWDFARASVHSTINGRRGYLNELARDTWFFDTAMGDQYSVVEVIQRCVGLSLIGGRKDGHLVGPLCEMLALMKAIGFSWRRDEGI